MTRDLSFPDPRLDASHITIASAPGGNTPPALMAAQLTKTIPIVFRTNLDRSRAGGWSPILPTLAANLIGAGSNGSHGSEDYSGRRSKVVNAIFYICGRDRRGGTCRIATPATR